MFNCLSDSSKSTRLILEYSTQSTQSYNCYSKKIELKEALELVFKDIFPCILTHCMHVFVVVVEQLLYKYHLFCGIRSRRVHSRLVGQRLRHQRQRHGHLRRRLARRGMRNRFCCCCDKTTFDHHLSCPLNTKQRFTNGTRPSGC